jgi:hypothetical protein
MGRQKVVNRYDRPAITQCKHIRSTHIHHRFDGDDQALLNEGPLPRGAKVGNLRL